MPPLHDDQKEAIKAAIIDLIKTDPDVGDLIANTIKEQAIRNAQKTVVETWLDAFHRNAYGLRSAIS